MDELRSESGKIWLKEAPIPFSPGKGGLKKDFALFGSLIFLQMVILPQIDLGHFKLDLFTPWLLLCSLRMNIGRILMFYLISILIMETSSSAPSGLYLVIYSMIGITLYAVKSQISWRRTVSWLYALAAATTMQGLLEGVSLYISEPKRQMGFYALTWASRITINFLLVLIVPTHWLSDEWMEDR